MHHRIVKQVHQHRPGIRAERVPSILGRRFLAHQQLFDT